MINRRLIIAGLMTLLISEQTYAQTVSPTRQTQILPGSILPQTLDPATKKPQDVDLVPQSEQDVKRQTDEQVTDETKNPELDPSLNVKFQVKTIEVVGANQLDPAAVRALVAQFEGKESTLQELKEQVADVLTKMYEDMGYVTTLVYIPPQKIENGVLKIQADEGIVNDIILENSRWFGRRAIMPRMAVKKGEIFQLKDLQKSLRRINTNPDIDLQATLRAGKEPSQTDVYLKPKKDIFPVHLTPFFDNLGRPFIGNQRLGATLSNNNVFGFGDTAYGHLAFTRESWTVVDGYEVPIGPYGTRVGFTHALNNFIRWYFIEPCNSQSLQLGLGKLTTYIWIHCLI